MKVLFLFPLCFCLASFGVKQVPLPTLLEKPIMSYVLHNDGSVFYIGTQGQSDVNEAQPVSYTKWFRARYGHDQYSREIKDIYIPQ